MENGTSSKIREVLIEEIGHFVDSRINQIDTPGDEGEYFAGLVTDQKLNKDEIDRLKAEDDLVVVTIDGKGVEVEQNTSTGTIQGLKWNDINANGLREELIQGNTPDIVFVIDVSGSTQDPFGGSSVGDVNKDGQPNTRLDAETAGFIALNNRLVGKGLDTARISIVSFTDSANQLDMDPTISGIQLTTNPGTDSNSNGIKDIEEVLISLRYGGGTDFKQPLQKAADTLTSIGTNAGNGNVIFISDGQVSVVNYKNEVLALQNAGVKLSAFGVGTNASIGNLQEIDRNASIFTSTDQLLSVFDGLGSGSQSFKEPGLAGVSIYLDLNNNGVLDTGEPTQVTAADNPSTTNIDETGQYSFTGVQPGTYIVREVVPSGFSQTFPNSPNYHSVNVASGQTVIKNFGNTTPPSITLTVNPASVVEDGTANLVYTFTRTGNLTNAITVNYTVQETATFNTDYTQTGAGSFTSTSGTVTFAAGSRTTTVTLDPTADTTVESDETVSLTLASGTGYTIDTTSAVTGTITNDDTNVTLAVSPSSVTEDDTGNLIYTFTRTGVISNALTVNYTVGGTATNGTDYSNIGTSVTFAANSATATVTVDPTADTTVESDETVSLTLASGTGYTLGTITAVTGTITNDDTNVTLAVSPSSVTEDGTGNLIYTFTRTGVIQYRDDDNNDLAAVKVVSLPSFGSLTFVNGQPISLNQRVSAVELLNVRYNPNANVNGQDTFNITAIDNGTPEAESGQAKVTINVTPVNDAPEFTLTGNIQALTGAVDQTVTGFAQNISAGPNESSQKFEFITTVTSGNEIFTKLPSIDVTGNLTYSLSKTPGTAAVKVLLKDDGGVANSGLDTTEKEFTVQSAIPLNPSVFEPNVDISAGLTFKPQTNGTVNLDTSRGSASLDQVQSVQSGTKSNFNHIIGLYEVMNNQGEIKDNQGNTLKPEDANYALHALTTARVKNFTLQAGGNDTPSTATQLGSGVSVLGGKFYAPFAIANGGTYFPGNQGIEDFVAAEQGDINRFSTALPYVRDLVAREGKNGDVFNNAPRFVQEPVAYFTFGAANPDKSAHFRSYGNGVYGFEDLPADLTQYSNNDFNDAVFALKLTT
nr:Calx-beta domain-containing protein [Cylindrospermopsis raciborskii]